jgi:predicted peroxiredoxin
MKTYKLIKTYSGNWSNDLDQCLKLKVKIFTTEDGVDIFENDKYSRVEPGFNIYNYKACLNEKAIENVKYFSTKEKSEEYVLMNKPCLSLKDIETSYIESFKSVEGFLFKLKELVKTKL